jgi:hypothetical protein
MSKLRPGTYQVTITGPQGVLMSMSLNMETRAHFTLALDDEWLPELLVLNSIPQGIIENELHEQQKKEVAA